MCDERVFGPQPPTEADVRLAEMHSAHAIADAEVEQASTRLASNGMVAQAPSAEARAAVDAALEAEAATVEVYNTTHDVGRTAEFCDHEMHLVTDAEAEAG